jgi:hypothetical protein
MAELLFTYDYELFLGEDSGNLKETLIIPTRKILKIHKNFGAKAIFFVDTLYLYRLQRESQHSEKANSDYILISKQLNELIKFHTVYIHLHPHWLDAIYDSKNGKWNLSNHDRYTLDSFYIDEINQLFDMSIKVLRDILNDPNYESAGYRAGGWSIQPFTKFKEAFYINGIKTDYSVIPGMKYYSTAQKFDFLDAPKERKKYNFSNCPSEEDIFGDFIEIPISSYSISPLENFIRRIYLKIKRDFFQFMTKIKGSTVSAKDVSKQTNLPEFSFVAQIENLDPILLFSIFKTINKKKYLHFVSHPKLMTSFDMVALKLLLKYAK